MKINEKEGWTGPFRKQVKQLKKFLFLVNGCRRHPLTDLHSAGLLRKN